MSMHEIEDLVEASIRTLDRHHPPSDDRLRDWFVRLYEFQNVYDCSWTMGRVHEILFRRRHTYRFPLSAHPDYADRRPFFDGLTLFTDLALPDPFGDEQWADALTDGYADPPWLYCEAGSALWKRLVDGGLLTGADAAPPRPAVLIDVVLAVAAAAEQDGEVDLIAGWWAQGPDALLDGAPLDAADVAASRGVPELREIFHRTGAIAAPALADHRSSPEQPTYMDDPRETWWFHLPA